MKIFIILFACLLMLSGCSDNIKPTPESTAPEDNVESVPAGYPVTIGDTTIPSKPQRVISLSPSLTEIAFDMGYISQIAGVSDYCDFPTGVENTPDCGTVNMPDIEKISSLGADTVISSSPLIESELIKLQQMNVNVLQFQRAKTFGELQGLYQNIGMLFEGEKHGAKKGNEYYAQKESVLNELQSSISKSNIEPMSVAYVSVLDFNIATGDTLESKLLELIGLKNVGKPYTDWIYPEEALDEFYPAVIFFDTSISEQDLRASKKFSSSLAVKNNMVFQIDMSVFERQSPRMYLLIQDMATKIYTDVFDVK